jgi:hypothetical protein
MKTATPRFAVAGFTSTGIHPFNPDVLPEAIFTSSFISASVTLQRQPRSGNPMGSRNQERTATHKEDEIARSRSVGRSVRETMLSRDTGR